MALCILGLDFMIYVLVKLLYGDRRSLIARRVAQERKAAKAEGSELIFVPAGKSTPRTPEILRSNGSRVPNARFRKPFASRAFPAPLTSGRHQPR